MTRVKVARRFAKHLSDEEWKTLTGVEPGVELEDKPAEEEKKVGRLPALWAEHVQPLLAR